MAVRGTPLFLSVFERGRSETCAFFACFSCSSDFPYLPFSSLKKKKAPNPSSILTKTMGVSRLLGDPGPGSGFSSLAGRSSPAIFPPAAEGAEIGGAKLRYSPWPLKSLEVHSTGPSTSIRCPRFQVRPPVFPIRAIPGILPVPSSSSRGGRGRGEREPWHAPIDEGGVSAQSHLITVAE